MNTPLGINLSSLSLMDELLYRLAQITDDQIAAADRRLTAICPHEKELGVVASEATRALYTLGRLLSSEYTLLEAQAGGVTDEIEEKELRSKAAFADMLEDVVTEMWWTQAKMDIEFKEKESVGIRKGWVIVREAQRSGPAGMIEAIIHRGFPGM